MQRNEVIDLRNYRGAKDDPTGENDEASGDELPPGTSILHGQYKITGFLNSGGFGITYRAIDSLEREVVIKECFPGVMCFRAGLDVRVRSRSHEEEFSSMVRSFVKEAHALAAMDHKNIVRVHQVFEENETAYMAIDYIDGLDLLDVIEQQPDRLGPREIEAITRKTLRAIKYVHDRGMLHRDISPDNILLDADDEPILIDFGAAREKAKKSGRVMSRLKFVKDGYSPQEFYVEGSEQGPWSDLYSFAASLYHLIDGAPPNDGQKRLSALAQKQADPYEPLHGRIKGYSRGYLSAIDKALEVIPRNRFQSAEEWLDAIRSGQERRTSRTRSRDRGDTTGLRDAPVTTVPAPRMAGTDSQVAPPLVSDSVKAGKSKSVPSKESFGAPAPTLSERDSQLTPEERLIRDSMKGDLRPQSNRNSALMITVAVAAIVSVLGTVAIFTLSGGRDADTLTDVEVASAPAAAPQSAATSEDVTPPAVIPPAEPDLPKSSQAVASTDTARTLDNSEAAPTVNPSEFGSVAEPASSTDSESIVSDTADDPRPDAIAALPVSGTTAPLAGAIPRPRPANLIAVPDNDAQFADLAFVLNEPTEVPGIPQIDPAQLVSNLAPTVFILDGTDVLAPAPLNDGSEPIAVSIVRADNTHPAAPSFPTARPGNLPVVETAAPAPLPEPIVEGPLVAAQIQYSHWDVEMPFSSNLERLRSANTAQITSVSPNADLAISGDWIAEGVTIYTFNGQKLMAETPLSVHVLTALSIDPDGYSRASVRYQPEGGTIDRGLLAVPVIREIGLADGTILTARNVDLAWVITVKSLGNATESTLSVGDHVVQETQTGFAISGHEDLQAVLDALVARGLETAEFNVIRNGTPAKASLKLARESGRGG